VCGYLGFLDDTQGNILNNFGGDDGLIESMSDMAIAIARFMLALTMFATFPMESFVARHAIITLFYGGQWDDDENDENVTVIDRSSRVTISLFVAALIPAMLLHDLGVVLALAGTIGGSYLSYIAPGLIYLAVNGERFLALTERYVFAGREDAGRRELDEEDLPVAGEAGIKIEAPEQGRAPWWYYFLLFPLWTYVAKSKRNEGGGPPPGEGAGDAVAVRASRHGDGNEGAVMSPFSSMSTEAEELPDVSAGDFAVAIFFVVFGVVATVAGLYSLFVGGD